MSRDLDPSNWISEKLAWTNAACRDPNLSHLEVRVALLIQNDLNATELCAFRGQDGIAEIIGSNPRSVRAALAGLIKAGYLRKQARGRTKTNAYYATFPDHIPARNTTAIVASDRQKSAGHTSINDNVADAMTGENPPSRPAESRRLTLRENPITPTPQDRGRRRRHPEPQPTPAPSWPAFRDLKVRSAIVEEFGEPFVRSYLDQAAWEASGRQVVCRSSTGHARLKDKAAKRLSAMGVRLVLDPTLHARLPRPMLPMDEAA